jgi:transglutaminase-like putative cysteine protease
VRAAQLDGRGVDWSRVRSAVFGVRVHYRYTYTEPVTDVNQRLVLVPPDRHGRQRLLGYRLEVRGAGGAEQVVEEQDPAGNRLHWVRAARVDHAVDFEARYTVATEAGGARRDQQAAAAGLDAASLRRYLQPTGLTAPDARLRAAARDVRAAAGPRASARQLAERAHHWAGRALVSQFGVTDYRTPAGLALHLGKGVCQDFAHILLALLRLLDIPARYVSGHLLGEGPPHAWVEALCEDRGAPGGVAVLGLDPSHRRRVGPNYITVAVGRDFADVTPTSGSFSGLARGSLSYTKRAQVVELAYRDPAAARDPEAAA